MELISPQVLTKRELEVVRYMADGYNGPSICANLEITQNTIRTYRVNIYRKLRVNCVPEVVAWYYKTFWRPKEL